MGGSEEEGPQLGRRVQRCSCTGMFAQLAASASARDVAVSTGTPGSHAWDATALPEASAQGQQPSNRRWSFLLRASLLVSRRVVPVVGGVAGGSYERESIRHHSY